jgi:HEPN domain-containing protein
MGRLYVEEARGRLALVRVAWFQSAVDRLAAISTEMAGDRGPAFYGDERQEPGPQELFDEHDARGALRDAELVAELSERLLVESD